MLFLFCVTGCGKLSEEDILKKIDNKIKNSYKLSGSLSILNNDDVYNYDVEVSYKADNYYKVSLTNEANGHTQVILKNNDGVYILTPALNKSFKFQSDWPYDNSQIYLLQALINDIKKDESSKFSIDDSGYSFIAKVNYPNNKMLVNEKIFIDKNLDTDELLKKVAITAQDYVIEGKINELTKAVNYLLDNLLKVVDIKDMITKEV